MTPSKHVLLSTATALVLVAPFSSAQVLGGTVNVGGGAGVQAGPLGATGQARVGVDAAAAGDALDSTTRRIRKAQAQLDARARAEAGAGIEAAEAATAQAAMQADATLAAATDAGSGAAGALEAAPVAGAGSMEGSASGAASLGEASAGIAGRGAASGDVGASGDRGRAGTDTGGDPEDARATARRGRAEARSRPDRPERP